MPLGRPVTDGFTAKNERMKLSFARTDSTALETIGGSSEESRSKCIESELRFTTVGTENVTECA
jgi:hypothetical protein